MIKDLGNAKFIIDTESMASNAGHRGSDSRGVTTVVCGEPIRLHYPGSRMR